MSGNYLLEMKNITKEFPGVLALDNITLNVRRGTVHALMGENGAGKSTLMKILIGIYKPDKGEIRYKDQAIHIRNTHFALKHGISMIHQELNPVPHMSIAENIFLGREPKNKLGFINHKKMNNDSGKLLKQIYLDIDPTTRMVDLSIANTQMVEIAKAISYNSDLIIMDEPTSAITDKEVGHLFEIIGELKKKGVAIIYITHKMDEVFKISDDVTILRDGQFIGTKHASELNKDTLIGMMVGRELSRIFPKETVPIGEEILSVKGLTRNGHFRDVSFNLKKGEILGVAGLMGAGRTEVMECLFGVTKKSAGDVFVKGEKVNIKSPKDAIKYKMAFLTEDRKLTGLYLMLSVKDNMSIANIAKYLIGKLFVSRRRLVKDCLEEKNKLKIKTPDIEQIIGNLSGGNQQKVLLSRWILTNPDILILDEPTRGIDVGAKSEIHKIMTNLVREGKSVIMISSELPEVLGMSDRILVMREGKVAGCFDRNEVDSAGILEHALPKKDDYFDKFI